jgi:hypothetical protein
MRRNQICGINLDDADSGDYLSRVRSAKSKRVRKRHVQQELFRHGGKRRGAGQGFAISAARRINTALRDGERHRHGNVFSDRYHLKAITSPTQAHRTLGYVLGNWRHHGEDREGLASTWLVDPFSTAILPGR